MSNDNLEDLLPVAQEKDAAMEVRLAEQHIELAAKLLATKLVFHVPADGTLYEAVERVADGGTIKLAAGCFKLDKTLYIRRSVKIQGAGTGESAISMLNLEFDGDGIKVSGEINFSLYDLHLRTLSYRNYQLNLNVSSFLVSACRFELPITIDKGEINHHAGLLKIESGQGTVRDSRFSGYHNGILVSGRNSNVKLINNHCSSTYVGIITINQAKATLSGNRVSSCRVAGIVVARDAQVTATDNICEHNDGTGFIVASAKAKMERNTCRRNGYGIFCYSGAKCTINNNICEKNIYAGIWIGEDSSVTARKNQCSDNKQNGIIFSDKSSGVVEQNVCENNEWDGIRITSEGVVSVQGNKCRRNKQNGMLFWDHAGGTINKNSCEENEWDGIRIERTNAQGFQDNTQLPDSPTIDTSTQKKSQENADCASNANEDSEQTHGQSEQQAILTAKRDDQEDISFGPDTMEVVPKRRSMIGKLTTMDQTSIAEVFANKASRNKRAGISCWYGVRAILKENICRDNGMEGIVTAYQSELELAANRCTRNGSHGVFLFEDSTGILTDNICENNESSGIEIDTASEAKLFANHCLRNKIHGICFARGSVGTAAKNVCKANHGQGITIYRTEDVEIIDNQCDKNRGGGVSFVENSKGLAKNNICENNGMNGIIIDKNSQGTIKGNICRANARCGIELTNNAKAEISSNTFSENLVGIWFREGSQGSITENVCEHNTWSGGIRLGTEHPVAVRNNRCNGNSNNGISFMGEGEGQNWATGNTCNGNDGVGIAIYDGLVEVADNQCFRNRVYGIQFDTRSEGSAHGNRCGENGKKDIHASKKSKTLLDGSNKTMLLLQDLGDITKGDIE